MIEKTKRRGDKKKDKLEEKIKKNIVIPPPSSLLKAKICNICTQNTCPFLQQLCLARIIRKGVQTPPHPPTPPLHTHTHKPHLWGLCGCDFQWLCDKTEQTSWWRVFKKRKLWDRRHRLHNIADENAEEEEERRRAKSYAAIQSWCDFSCHIYHIIFICCHLIKYCFTKRGLLAIWARSQR